KEKRVSNGLLRKLLGRRASAPPVLAEAIAELEKLAQTRASLQAPCEVLAAIVVQLFAEPAPEIALGLSAAVAKEKLASGIPLLRGASLDFDSSALRRRFLG